MTTRRRLPPGVRKFNLKSGVRYELVIDLGPDPVTGKRRQARTRYATEDEVLAAHAKTAHDVASGTHVARSTVTVDQVCADYLAGRHKISAGTRANYASILKPFRTRYGHLSVQSLTKRHLDDLLGELRATGFPRSDGKPGRVWGARSVNLMITVIRMVLESAMRQGMVHRNVAALVDRLPSTQREMDTFTAAEVTKVLTAAEKDRNGHAWHLALSGLRRGELSGLRWSDIDLSGGTLTVANTRVSIDGQVDEKAPKTARSLRTLPLTPGLSEVLRRAQRRQHEERLAFGPEYTLSGYVVVDEAGRPYHPETISDYWDRMLAGAKVRRIRLHDARHTCGTLMHLQGVPVAVISAWLGHADAAFTMRTYVHSQDDALVAAAAVLGDLMSPASRAV